MPQHLISDRIQEETEYTSSRSRLPSRGTLTPSMGWPFHHRNTSEVPSSTWSSHMNLSGLFRPTNGQRRSFFHSHAANQDDAISIARSIVPDYIVNFLRGETPETLARKKESQQWGRRGIEIIPNHRDTLASCPVEFGHYYSSTTDLTDPNEHSSRSQNGLRRHFTGWRGGVVFNTVLTFIILVAGIVCLILAFTKSKAQSGESSIYSGDCTKAHNLNIGLHVVINVFTVVLLAGANYVFHVLSSPTRREVTTAHEKRRWLDIGIPSLRNFAHISSFRATLTIIIMLAAVANQVIYNAVIFTSQSTQETCSVNVSGSMLGVAALLNLVTFLSLTVVLTRSSFKPLATLGDAIRSFLENPDETTTGVCLLSKDDVRQGRWESTKAKYFPQPTDHHWIQSPSLARWAVTILSWLAASVPTAVALALMIRANNDNSLTPFGTATANATFLLPSSFTAPQMAIIASLPQLLLAILYLTINSLLTTYFLSQEIALFAVGPRALRVSSNPSGRQSTSLYLTLPRPVSWMLLAVFAALGLVLSQAVFPAALDAATATAFAPSSSPDHAASAVVPAIAFSTQALLTLIVILIVILVALLIAVLGLGLRLTPAARLADGTAKGNPIALQGGSCSAALSAKCHPAAGEGEIWLGRATWGVVQPATGVRVGRCAFSGEGAGCVDVGRSYA
ncbi:Uu.00g098300.m01.CDS01 [Anthostomella pinea]|uniref:Uu.00g098300.m01.CDS01 n=1 Tax=Anthostomella pinea TaxID=933095 RepID=A0AAI8VDK8_9PEZI|nr:Uu.00g098300.m01.CDS01 [Anthostomella pinea]